MPFAAVEHEQDGTQGREPRNGAGERWCGRIRAGRGGDRGRHERRVDEVPERDPDASALRRDRGIVRDLDGEPRLARAAGAHQRDVTRVTQSTDRPGALRRPPDEAVEGTGRQGPACDGTGLEHPEVERRALGCRVDAELVGEYPTAPVECADCAGAVAGREVRRDHPPVRRLVERVCGEQGMRRLEGPPGTP